MNHYSCQEYIQNMNTFNICKKSIKQAGADLCQAQAQLYLPAETALI